jgi:hypothetical protein
VKAEIHLGYQRCQIYLTQKLVVASMSIFIDVYTHIYKDNVSTSLRHYAITACGTMEPIAVNLFDERTVRRQILRRFLPEAPQLREGAPCGLGSAIACAVGLYMMPPRTFGLRARHRF